MPLLCRTRTAPHPHTDAFSKFGQRFWRPPRRSVSKQRPHASRGCPANSPGLDPGRRYGVGGCGVSRSGVQRPRPPPHSRPSIGHWTYPSSPSNTNSRHFPRSVLNSVC